MTKNEETKLKIWLQAVEESKDEVAQIRKEAAEKTDPPPMTRAYRLQLQALKNFTEKEAKRQNRPVEEIRGELVEALYKKHLEKNKQNPKEEI